MQKHTIIVRADWDEEAGVWVATTSDIEGLAVEAETLEKLSDKVCAAIVDLVELNGFLGKTTGASKGSRPAPKAKITGRPTGGLKPNGFKIKIEKKF